MASFDENKMREMMEQMAAEQGSEALLRLATEVAFPIAEDARASQNTKHENDDVTTISDSDESLPDVRELTSKPTSTPQKPVSHVQQSIEVSGSEGDTNTGVDPHDNQNTPEKQAPRSKPQVAKIILPPRVQAALQKKMPVKPALETQTSQKPDGKPSTARPRQPNPTLIKKLTPLRTSAAAGSPSRVKTTLPNHDDIPDDGEIIRAQLAALLEKRKPPAGTPTPQNPPKRHRPSKGNTP